MGTPFSNLVIQMSLWTLLLVADWCSGLHAESILTPGLPIENMSVSHKENVRFTDPQPSGQSCDFETSCPWVSSTRNDGTPHWVPTVIGTLTLPEQDQLLESKSSKKGIQGGILLLNTSHISQDCLASSLLSPMFPGSLGPCSLELSIYAQDDSAAERLTVLIQNMNVNISLMLLPSREVNARSGWKLLYSNIGAIDGPFQISLNYTSCGLDNNKILALDSLSLSNCFDGNVSSCPWESSFICENGICINRKKLCDFQFDCPLGDDEGLVCDNILPFGSHCSFEDGTCGWAFNGSGESSWIHTSLAEIDHEVSEQIVTLQDLKPVENPVLPLDCLLNCVPFVPGYFLHLHIEGQQREGRAGMYSESLPGLQTNKVCQFSFNFFIYGILNGTLAVYVLEENGGENPLKLWERNGTQSDYWSSATLEVPSFQNRFRLQLLASWGWNSVAHIAIDNITFAVDCFHTGRIEMRHRIHGQPLEMDQTEDNSLSSLSVPQHTEIEWWFNSCGASGPRGPTQAQCDNAYRNTNTSVEVGKYGPLRGIQMWKVPFTDVYKISAYGAAGGTGAKNHNKRCHGIFISAVFHLQRDEVLYILVGQQGEDACPGKNKATQEICLGESSVIEDEDRDNKTIPGWAGGGGAGGGATYIFKKINGVYFPLLVAAGGGGKAYLENPDGSLKLEQFQNSTSVPGLNGKSGAAGGGGGWSDITELPWAGRSLMEGGEGGQSCYQAMATLQWDTSGGFGGGGGACTSGGGGGGYQGGYVSQSDDITADGQDGVSFFHPSGEIFIHPLAVEENHGELHIELNLNCSHCNSGNCKRDESRKKAVCVCQPGTVLAKDNITCIVEENHGELHIELDLNCSHCNSGNCKRDESRKKAVCVCQPGTVLAKDNITCIASKGLVAERQLSLPLILAVLVATVILGLIFACGSLSFVYHRKKKQLEGARVRLQSTEYKLSKIRSSIIMTDYNPNYCFAGKGASLSELKEVPRKNITLLRALGHGAFGEVYEGLVVGLSGDPNPSQVAIKTLPEICSEQDEMDFLMEALIISKFSHQNIVRCIGVSLQTLPRFILLELMSGGDMKTFLRQNRPWVNQPSSLTMLDLLNMARDIACGCKYLEENQFIHRDIAARNCLLTYSGTGRVAKIGDFGMARDIYRASYYRKGGRAMLPVKWMPPEAFLEGIFTSKTDSWSFGVLLWEIFSLGYMPYPCKTNQEVLEFVTSGGRMDPPKNCPGPVYRIMTQCWQHMPDYRPNFSTILERIIYCTQDPDVINTELPVESGPAPEDEGSTVMRPGSCNGLTPLMSNPPLPSLIDTQTTEYKLGELPQEIMVENLVGWNIKSPNLQCIRESTEGSWLQSNPTSLTETKPQEAHKLKNKTKNLWNPTYGSWVMESTC